MNFEEKVQLINGIVQTILDDPNLTIDEKDYSFEKSNNDIRQKILNMLICIYLKL